jgi:hypothetical protein
MLVLSRSLDMAFPWLIPQSRHRHSRLARLNMRDGDIPAPDAAALHRVAYMHKNTRSTLRSSGCKSEQGRNLQRRV